MAETTVYYRLPDGSVGSRTGDVSEGGGIQVPEGAVLITAEEYEATIAAAEAEREARAAEIRAREREQARQTYESLIAAGFPEDAARRMSGYWPDPEES